MSDSNNKVVKTFSGKLFSDMSHFVNADGLHIFTNCWEPKGDVNFLVCMLHGFGGHCIRFNELASYFTEIGGLVFSHDHIGHGESEGSRTTVDDYNKLIRDTYQHVDIMVEKYPGKPVYIFGQSMGGALAVLAAHAKPTLFKGVILVGPMLLIDPGLQSSFRRVLVKMAAYLLPNVVLTSLPESRGSRDQDEIKISQEDPLKSCDVKSEMALQLLRIGEQLEVVMPQFTCPFITLHGGDDSTCSVEASKLIHRVAKSEDKTLKIYELCRHDLVHELQEDRIKCFTDIQNWLKERLQLNS
nr:monoglyceride lipase-like [Ciona intestinalis]|eukprot:XP_009859011.1 monoglyceride lipase-like [Ciona intestinalis]